MWESVGERLCVAACEGMRPCFSAAQDFPKSVFGYAPSIGKRMVV